MASKGTEDLRPEEKQEKQEKPEEKEADSSSSEDEDEEASSCSEEETSEETSSGQTEGPEETSEGFEEIKVDNTTSEQVSASNSNENTSEKPKEEPTSEQKQEQVLTSDRVSETEVKPDQKNEVTSDVENKADPFVVAEDQAEQPDPDLEGLELDSEGFLDVTGSGRLRVKTIVKADKSELKPQQGQELTCRKRVEFQGQELICWHTFDFLLQQSEVLTCIDLSVTLMRKGEEVHIIADPDIAYGKFGLPQANIPPNAAVDIYLTLLDIKDSPLVVDMPLEDRLRIGRRKKERGTFWFQREKYTEAIQCYRKSAEYFDDERIELEVPIDRYSLPMELQDLLEERLKALNNLAMAQLKIDANQAALTTLKSLLSVEPNNEKALYRKSKALVATSQIDLAMGVLKRVTRLYPTNVQAKADLVKLQAKNKKYRDAQEKMSKRMLGLDVVEKEKADAEAAAKERNSFVTYGVVIGAIACAALATYVKIR